MIAITGARGYLGAALCDALSRSGHRVRRLTRAPDGARGDAFFSLGEGVSDGALAGVETLIHAAHDFGPRREDELRRLNVAGSRRLFAAARGAGVRRILFVSSIASWAETRSAYGRAKWTLEQEVASRGGASIRPGLVFGVDKGGLTLRRVLAAIAAAAGRAPRFIRIPALPAVAGIRLLESAGFALPFPSDRLTSILHANPAPRLTDEVLGVRLRPLEPWTIDE